MKPKFEPFLGDLSDLPLKVDTYTDYTQNVAEEAVNKLYDADIEDKIYEPPTNLFGFFGKLFKPK